MSDLAPLLPLQSPPSEGGAGLPRHLYGTRAALFYLLRDTDGPAVQTSPAPVPTPQPAPLPVALPQTARVLPFAPDTSRPALRDLLHSDSFDFRSFGDVG